MRSVFVFLIFLCVSSAVEARPVSYPGGWTVITTNDKDSNAGFVHYTFTPKVAVGVRHEYFREDSVHADFVQGNVLLKRWNAPASQANLYLKSGVGIAYDGDDSDAAGFTGLAFDWENRRYFTSYENRFLYAEDLQSFAKHKARVGVAPYIGDIGDLHTWFMIEADYTPAKQDNFSVTPLVRFFKGTHLLEAGYNLDDGVLFNYTKRF